MIQRAEQSVVLEFVQGFIAKRETLSRDKKGTKVSSENFEPCIVRVQNDAKYIHKKHKIINNNNDSCLYN